MNKLSKLFAIILIVVGCSFMSGCGAVSLIFEEIDAHATKAVACIIFDKKETVGLCSPAPAPAPIVSTSDLAYAILNPVNVSNDVKADAYDAFATSKTAEELTSRLTGLSLPQSVKADLWDAGHATHPDIPQQKPHRAVKPFGNATVVADSDLVFACDSSVSLMSVRFPNRIRVTKYHDVINDKYEVTLRDGRQGCIDTKAVKLDEGVQQQLAHICALQWTDGHHSAAWIVDVCHLPVGGNQ